jgi:hypothetical protein
MPEPVLRLLALRLASALMGAGARKPEGNGRNNRTTPGPNIHA